MWSTRAIRCLAGRRTARRPLAPLALLAVLSAGCAHDHYAAQPAAPPPPYPQPAEIYVYPERGQSPERQDRDRFECYRWAVRQTRFDPSRQQAGPAPRVRVIPIRPPVADTIAGAATGAVIGGIATYSGEGAAIGAAIGGVVGAISDVHREHTRRDLERSLEARAPAGEGGRARRYRRALSACLEGRGYAVG
jgi:hypothetical protein